MEMTYWYFTSHVIDSSNGKTVSQARLPIASDTRFFPVVKATIEAVNGAPSNLNRGNLFAFIDNQVEISDVDYKAMGGK